MIKNEDIQFMANLISVRNHVLMLINGPRRFTKEEEKAVRRFIEHVDNNLVMRLVSEGNDTCTSEWADRLQKLKKLTPLEEMVNQEEEAEADYNQAMDDHNQHTALVSLAKANEEYKKALNQDDNKSCSVVSDDNEENKTPTKKSSLNPLKGFVKRVDPE
jgi:hypothetical protein